MGAYVAVPLAAEVAKATVGALGAAVKAVSHVAEHSLFKATANATLLGEVRETAEKAAREVIKPTEDEASQAKSNTLIRLTSSAAAEAAVKATSHYSIKELQETASEAAADASARARSSALSAIKVESKQEITEEDENKSDTDDNLNEFFNKFASMSGIFKDAKRIIGSNDQKRHIYEMYEGSFSKIAHHMENIRKWLDKQKIFDSKGDRNPEKLIEEYRLLEPLLQPLVAGTGHIRRLAEVVETQNSVDTPMTDAQMDSLRRGVFKINTTFRLLSGYVLGKTGMGNKKDLLPIRISDDDAIHFEKQP